MNKKNHRSFGYIRKLPSGRRQASYLGLNGVRYYAPNTFAVLKDASAWLAKRQVEIEQGIWSVPKSIETPTEPLIGELFETFTKTRITRSGKALAENTIAHYRVILNNPLRDFKEMKLSQITESVVSDWYSKQVATGKVTTTSKGYKLLKALCAWGVTQGYISSNPCNIRGAQTATSGRITTIPEPAEVRDISNGMPEHLKVSVMLAAYAGLRYGELTELRRKDVLIREVNGVKRLQVKVTRAVVWVNHAFIVGAPKSKASIRVIDVTSALIEELENHLNLFVGRNSESLLFPDTHWDQHLRHDKFIKLWNRALVGANLSGRGFTPHSLRHFGATNMLRCGATLPDLKLWLGDSSTEAVSRYLHATDRHQSFADSMEFIS